MKLALNVISEGTKDKQEQLERMLDSAVDFVDGVYITFTKSMETADFFKEKYKADVSFREWDDDFGAARRFAMEQVPEDKFEYILWLDTDDVLVHGEKIKMLPLGYDAYFWMYNYAIDPRTGEVVIKHPRERVVKRSSYRWADAMVHETCMGPANAKTIWIKDIWVDHLPTEKDNEEGYHRNERILEKAYVKEEGKDPRTVYYLARTCFDLEKYDRAEKLFKDYLVSSGWDEERAMACNYLGDIAQKAEKFEDAINWYFEAIKERPEFPTFYINIGATYAQMQRYDRAMHYTKLGLKIEQPNTSMVLLPLDDKLKALETLFVCLTNENKYKEALSVIEKQLQHMPESKLYIERRDFILQTLHYTDQAKVIAQMMEELDDERKAALLYALPDKLAETEFASRMRQKYLPSQEWPEKTIVYFCGKGFERWDETSLEKGVGGSETAVIQLSKEWAKLGYTVVVYGDPFEEHEKDGVIWVPYWKFNPFDTFDTLIIWRNETVLNAPLKARKIFLDLHDVPEPLAYTDDRLKKVDKIFVKSPYHRSLLPNVPDEKFIIVPNGIDLEMLPKPYKCDKKDGNKVVYASSYDRGLEQVLKIGWPIIKKAVPDAELHVFYGWNLFDTVHKHNPERQMWKKMIEELMTQPGVVHHGRVSQKELIEFKSTAKVHYYPTHFEEIDCISVRESASVKCTPITTAYAALEGREYCDTYPGDPYDKEVQETIAKRAVAMLQADVNQEGYLLAREENWTNIAKKWTDAL